MKQEQEARLPDGWKVQPLENLLDYVVGGDWGKDPNHDEDGYEPALVIRGSEIRNWKTEKGNTASIRKIKSQNVLKRKLQVGDILLEISGGGPEQPVGRTVLIDHLVLEFNPEMPKICTNFLRLLRPNSTVDSGFLNYYLTLFYASGEVVKYQGGSNNLRNLKYPDYSRIPIPLPPLPTQQAIVTKLEALLQDLDAGIAHLKKAQEQLKLYRQAVLKWAFEGRLTNEHVVDGELPAGWKWVRLGEVISDISAGKSLKCDERPPKNGELGIIKVSAVTWGRFQENESKTCFSEDSFNADYIIKSGDFLFSRANTIDLVGACVIVQDINKKLMMSDKTLRLTFKALVKPKLVLYYLRSKKGRSQIESHSSGNQDSMRNIGQSGIRQIEFPLMEPDAQEQVIAAIELRLQEADESQLLTDQLLSQTEALRQSVLKAAFEGRLNQNL